MVKGTEKTAYACEISESKEGAKVAFDSKYIRDIEGGVNSICIVEVNNNKDKIIYKYFIHRPYLFSYFSN